jgi:hypothetical protein
MARFPDSRIVAARLSSQFVTRWFRVFGDLCVAAKLSRTSDVVDATLPAYSGGTVWASHPLRVAAGVNVSLHACHAEAACRAEARRA